MSDWFYGKESMQYGPIGEATLKARIAIGEILPQDLVWRKGMGFWMPVQEVSDFYPTKIADSDSSDQTGAPKGSSSISQDFFSPNSSQNPDYEKLLCCELMMRSVEPTSKFFVFGTKGGQGCFHKSPFSFS